MSIVEVEEVPEETAAAATAESAVVDQVERITPTDHAN